MLDTSSSKVAGALNIVRKQPPAGSPSAKALAAGITPTPDHNLIFRGGKTIQSLTYQNLYVGDRRPGPQATFRTSITRSRRR